MVAMWWQPSGDDRQPGPQTLGAPRDLSVLERREATRGEGLRTPSNQKEGSAPASEGERDRDRAGPRDDARVRTGPPTRNGPGATAPPACPSNTQE